MKVLGARGCRITNLCWISRSTTCFSIPYSQRVRLSHYIHHYNNGEGGEWKHPKSSTIHVSFSKRTKHQVLKNKKTLIHYDYNSVTTENKSKYVKCGKCIAKTPTGTSKLLRYLKLLPKAFWVHHSEILSARCMECPRC